MRGIDEAATVDPDVLRAGWELVRLLDGPPRDNEHDVLHMMRETIDL